jgi:hypothetical protein
VADPEPNVEPSVLVGTARLNRLLNVILESAVDVLGFDAATLTTRPGGGEPTTVAATDQQLLAVDHAQYEEGAGPCVQAMDDVNPVVIEDMDEVAEERWQSFLETARYMGVKSSLSIHLNLEDSEALAASLNLYARSQRTMGAEQIRAASVFAAQLAAAMKTVESYEATARMASGLAEAMRTRAVIEQAKGMLMAERGITEDEAFDLLRALSQRSNTKLREVARRIVQERTAP